ncbi:polyketide synthase dehydratase domain-containing protein [Tahibacter amnicola]|uniref:Polyketide synthase dehydratase domain-containing protein n=1 Tax=Tahibacter amnicola TaxID=2976241 RepID=A0ABY6B7F6_9GAMM|nr:polyketide synthase dehydratase domain-containing protein [Tahibacter amnicola]UXI65929.1 polyketide synthase dehydratase domain-containing protein [Tahibacter amnicola]
MIKFIEYLLKDVGSNAVAEADVLHLLQELSGSRQAESDRLHPLLHRHASTPSALRFTSSLSHDDPLVAGHVLNGNPVLPGVAYLEMARAAWSRLAALTVDVASSTLVLRNVVWTRPLVLAKRRDICIELSVDSSGVADFSVYATGDASAGLSNLPVFAQGSVSYQPRVHCETRNVDELRRRCDVAVDVDECYAAFESMGLAYGPAYRSLRNVHVGSDPAGKAYVLARLRLAQQHCADAAQCGLSPDFLDSALQACIGLSLAELRAKGAILARWIPRYRLPLTRWKCSGLPANPVGPMSGHHRRAVTSEGQGCESWISTSATTGVMSWCG